MLDFDLSADIQALRSTFADIKTVVDVDALTAEIARLSADAGVPDLWDDPEKAQKVTSALSHRQSELARITGIERRLDDLEVMVELANEMDAKYGAGGTPTAYDDWEQDDRLRLQAEVARANELLATVATMTVIRRMN